MTSLANFVIQVAPCNVITCFCFVFETGGRTNTVCETNDHLFLGPDGSKMICFFYPLDSHPY